MKILRMVFATLAIGVASISTAQAHDSFSFGLNIGGGYPYYAPPVRYYAPPVVYYSEPVYYSAPPTYYYPQASFSYYGDGGHRDRHGWGHRGWDGRGRGDRGHRNDREHHDGHHWR